MRCSSAVFDISILRDEISLEERVNNSIPAQHYCDVVNVNTSETEETYVSMKENEASVEKGNSPTSAFRKWGLCLRLRSNIGI